MLKLPRFTSGVVGFGREVVEFCRQVVSVSLTMFSSNVEEQAGSWQTHKNSRDRLLDESSRCGSFCAGLGIASTALRGPETESICATLLKVGGLPSDQDREEISACDTPEPMIHR
jgi:hypothetical protein